ncbi:MAG: hypothetical protein QXX95_00155 [Nitrososphaerales archaeon]
MIGDEVLKHYNNAKVCEEIAKFAKDRWVSIHCSAKDEKGRLILKRYNGKREPITIKEKGDIQRLLKNFKDFKPRSFYATANLYRRISSFEDVMDYDNIIACTPTWDIDNTLEDWETTILVAREIVNLLKDFGIRKSVFLKWSGKGCHIHLHQNSLTILKENPLDIAYSIVEFVIEKLRDKIFDYGLKGKVLRVENRMDMQRLFTCPLSLHRTLNRVCVCIEPKDLENFNPSWTLPNDFKHYYEWDTYEEGEADELAKRAFEALGPLPYPRRRIRKSPPLDEQIRKFLRM